MKSNSFKRSMPGSTKFSHTGRMVARALSYRFLGFVSPPLKRPALLLGFGLAISTLGLFPDVQAQNCRIEAFPPINGGVSSVPAFSNSKGEMILQSRDLSGAVVATEFVSARGVRTRYSDLKRSEQISGFADDGSAIFSGPNGHRLALSPGSPAVQIEPRHIISGFSTAAIVGLVDDDDSDKYHAVIRKAPGFEMETLEDLSHSSWAKAVNSRGDTVVATFNEDWSPGRIVVRASTGKVQEVPLPRTVNPGGIHAMKIGADGTILAAMSPSDPNDDGTLCVEAKKRQNGSYTSRTVPVPGRKSGDQCYVSGGPNNRGEAAFTFVNLQSGYVTLVPYVKNADGTVIPYTAICSQDPRFFVRSLTGISDSGVLIGRVYDPITFTEVAVRITRQGTPLSSGR
jgi:hypothetical protein